MSADRLEDAAERLRVALDLFAAGEAMMREKLRREHPDATDEQVEELVCRWLTERPGAELGDAAGLPGTWPRQRP